MATAKKTATKKTAKSRDKKGQPKEGRDKAGKFTKDNKINERWTEKTVLPILEAMWKDLTTDGDGQPPEDRNVIRANDIKLLGEICIMHSVSKQKWNEWEDKFAPFLKDGVTANPNFSEPVTDLIKNIRWLLECRLNYSGGTMDIFILKNHYQYKDQQHIDTTTKGESTNQGFYEFLKQTSAYQTGASK
jgi:hypothetical protein